jgi:hypothetical protein
VLSSPWEGSITPQLEGEQVHYGSAKFPQTAKTSYIAAPSTNKQNLLVIIAPLEQTRFFVTSLVYCANQYFPALPVRLVGGLSSGHTRANVCSCRAYAHHAQDQRGGSLGRCETGSCASIVGGEEQLSQLSTSICRSIFNIGFWLATCADQPGFYVSKIDRFAQGSPQGRILNPGQRVASRTGEKVRRCSGNSTLPSRM